MERVPAVNLPALPRPLPPPPRELRFTIAGDVVPAQMGAILPNGRVARKGTERVRAYKQHVGLLAMLAVNTFRWQSTREESFAVTYRLFVGNARTIDADNCAKALGDAIKGVVFPDDRQIVELHVFKSIDREKPRVEVTIDRLDE